MNRLHLKALFGAIVSSTTLVVACGEDGGEEISKEGMQPICASRDDGLLPGAAPATGIDYLELRSESLNGFVAETNPGVTVASRFGTACATATDKAKCTTTLKDLRSTTGWQFGGQAGVVVSYLVATRGDTVEPITTLDALTRVLGPIDTLQEAGLLASLVGPGSFDCTKPVARKVGDGFEVVTKKGSGCGERDDITEHRLGVSSTGAVTNEETALVQKGEPGCAIGRVPEGLVPVAERARARDADLGAHFARAARLEAASVTAFERLAEELAALGAPPELVATARRSADDERRHALSTAKLAERFGGEPLPVDIAEVAARSLVDIALENAVEGCVRESFGAIVALYQAEHATDAEVRREMRVIAEDETNHAVFSWELHAWACAHLSTEDSARVEAARAAAMREMAEALTTESTMAANALAGWPSVAVSRSMFAKFERGVA